MEGLHPSGLEKLFISGASPSNKYLLQCLASGHICRSPAVLQFLEKAHDSLQESRCVRVSACVAACTRCRPQELQNALLAFGMLGVGIL